VALIALEAGAGARRRLRSRLGLRRGGDRARGQGLDQRRDRARGHGLGRGAGHTGARGSPLFFFVAFFPLNWGIPVYGTQHLSISDLRRIFVNPKLMVV